jgi:exopolysaccharide biosynthesis WecB/TagA/CpsF family protein
MWALIDQAAFALSDFLISLLLARWLTLEEDRAPIDQINQSEAGLVFSGLGGPKQEHFAYDHRHQIKGVQLCVGVAFDFHAGCKKWLPDGCNEMVWNGHFA